MSTVAADRYARILFLESHIRTVLGADGNPLERSQERRMPATILAFDAGQAFVAVRCLTPGEPLPSRSRDFVAGLVEFRPASGLSDLRLLPADPQSVPEGTLRKLSDGRWLRASGVSRIRIVDC
jgi:hypothetical protein